MWAYFVDKIREKELGKRKPIKIGESKQEVNDEDRKLEHDAVKQALESSTDKKI